MNEMLETVSESISRDLSGEFSPDITDSSTSGHLPDGIHDGFEFGFWYSSCHVPGCSLLIPISNYEGPISKYQPLQANIRALRPIMRLPNLLFLIIDLRMIASVIALLLGLSDYLSGGSKVTVRRHLINALAALETDQSQATSRTISVSPAPLGAETMPPCNPALCGHPQSGTEPMKENETMTRNITSKDHESGPQWEHPQRPGAPLHRSNPPRHACRTRAWVSSPSPRLVQVSARCM